MVNCIIKAYTRKGSSRDKNEDACGIAEKFHFGENKNSLELHVDTTTLPIL
jgi:hypothetical protein